MAIEHIASSPAKGQLREALNDFDAELPGRAMPGTYLSISMNTAWASAIYSSLM
jgi:hypothetical protein